VQVREIDDDEGCRLSRIVRCGTGSVVTWRRARMVLLSAQKVSVAKIAEVTFTSEAPVRDVIHDFTADGFDSLYPKYAGGRPRVFNLPERREKEAGAVPGVLPLPAHPAPAGHPNSDHLRQLLTVLEHEEGHPSRGLGRSEQRRDRLHPDQQLLAQQSRGPDPRLRKVVARANVA
jgi:hypothetical protein